MFELHESTLVDAMRRRGQDHPEGTAFVFLENGEQESVRLTAGEADARARVIAASLQAKASAGDRALLAYPSGAEFGVAVNQDGRPPGLTAPNGPAQQAVIREALTDSDITPARVGYVEPQAADTEIEEVIL